MTKKEKLLKNDNELRFIVAFDQYKKQNPNWLYASELVLHNKNILSNLDSIYNENEYFIFMNHFYDFEVISIENNELSCKMCEYSEFYELADHYLEFNFTYNILEDTITSMQDVKKVEISDEKKIIKKKEIA